MQGWRAAPGNAVGKQTLPARGDSPQAWLGDLSAAFCRDEPWSAVAAAEKATSETPMPSPPPPPRGEDARDQCFPSQGMSLQHTWLTFTVTGRKAGRDQCRVHLEGMVSLGAWLGVTNTSCDICTLRAFQLSGLLRVGGEPLSYSPGAYEKSRDSRAVNDLAQGQALPFPGLLVPQDPPSVVSEYSAPA